MIFLVYINYLKNKVLSKLNKLLNSIILKKKKHISQFKYHEGISRFSLSLSTSFVKWKSKRSGILYYFLNFIYVYCCFISSKNG